MKYISVLFVVIFLTNCGFAQVIRRPTNRYPGIIRYGDFSSYSEVVSLANKICKERNKKALIEEHKLHSVRDITNYEYYPWSRGRSTRLITYQITFTCEDY